MNVNTVIRQFQEADVEQVCQLYIEHGFDGYDHIPSLKNSQAPYAQKIVDTDLRNIGANYLDKEGANFWVCEEVEGNEESTCRSRIVGTCAIIPGEFGNGGGVYELVRMVVHPDQRGKGMAKKLYTAAETFVREEMKGDKLFLTTLLENIMGCKFYEKCGLVKVGDPQEFRLPEVGTVIRPQRFEKCFWRFFLLDVRVVFGDLYLIEILDTRMAKILNRKLMIWNKYFEGINFRDYADFFGVHES